jgi:hypothetical protein
VEPPNPASTSASDEDCDMHADYSLVLHSLCMNTPGSQEASSNDQRSPSRIGQGPLWSDDGRYSSILAGGCAAPRAPVPPPPGGGVDLVEQPG